MNSDWLNWMFKLASVGAGISLALLGALVYLQEKIIYVPRLPGMSSRYAFYPAQFDLDHDDVYLDGMDGARLHAWFMWAKGLSEKQRREQPTVIFFQENAGNMSYRLHFLGPLASWMKVNVFILGYRGYGESTGSPSQQGFEHDALEAISYVCGRADVDPGRVVLFGRSIGGAVALHAAAATGERLAGVVIENTFTSLEELVPVKMPFLRPFIGPGRPANWLLRNKWDNVRAAQKLTDLPALWLSSERDEMLPPEHMKRLFGLHPEAPWRFVSFPRASHMDAYVAESDAYWPVLFHFLQSVAGTSSGGGQAAGPPPSSDGGPKTEPRAPPPTGLQGRLNALTTDWDAASNGSGSDWETVTPSDARDKD